MLADDLGHNGTGGHLVHAASSITTIDTVVTLWESNVHEMINCAISGTPKVMQYVSVYVC